MSYEGELIKLNEEVAAKQSAMSKMFDGVTELSGTKATDRASEIRQANEELTDLSKKRDETKELADIEKANRDAVKASRQNVQRQVAPETEGPGESPVGTKSLGQVLAGNEAYQNAIKSGRPFRGDLGEVSFGEATKATSTTADMVGPSQRLPLVLDAQEARTTADLMLQGTTSASTIEYYEETTFTNAAAEVAEGAAKPEGAVDFTLVSESVRKIAVWIPVTDEMMADNEGFESYLRGRLGFMIKQREELQLLVGDGTPPNISGILDRSGIQTQAKGTDPALDAIFKAMTKVRNVGFAEPTAVVLHPNDWQDIRLLRTADGIYIFGSPADSAPERVWGLEVRVTSNITEGTGLVGAFRPDAQIFRKGGVELAVSDSHASYFISNLLAVRAEERIALAVYRPASFASVTGI